MGPFHPRVDHISGRAGGARARDEAARRTHFGHRGRPGARGHRARIPSQRRRRGVPAPGPGVGQHDAPTRDPARLSGQPRPEADRRTANPRRSTVGERAGDEDARQDHPHGSPEEPVGLPTDDAPRVPPGAGRCAGRPQHGVPAGLGVDGRHGGPRGSRAEIGPPESRGQDSLLDGPGRTRHDPGRVDGAGSRRRPAPANLRRTRHRQPPPRLDRRSRP